MHQGRMQQKEDLVSSSTLLPTGGPDIVVNETASAAPNRETKKVNESYEMQSSFDQGHIESRAFPRQDSCERVGNVTTGLNFAGFTRGSEGAIFHNFPVSAMDSLHAINRNVPQNSLHSAGSYGTSGSEPDRETPTRFLWIGNLTLKATRPMLCNVFERFGLLEDLVAFPGRMYAFVTYQTAESAAKALQSIQGAVIKDITGDKGMVIKYRPERKACVHDSESIRGSSSPLRDMDVEPSPRIWLGNIAPSATAANLQSVLGRFGHLVDAAVFPARIGPLGYAFVKFERIEDAVNAYNTLNNVVVPALSGTKQVKMRYKPVSEGAPARDTTLDALQASIPSRHIWLGNVTQKPSEDILIKIFSRFGDIESARVFSAKSYAFVNFYDVTSAIEAITKLDGVSVPVLTGLKPLVMRYQHDSSTVPACNLNSKLMEIVARSRAVPDTQQRLTSNSFKQHGMNVASPDLSLLTNLPARGHATSTPSAHVEQSQTEAARITSMLQSLASLHPSDISKYQARGPGYMNEHKHEIGQLGQYTYQHMWNHNGKGDWEPPGPAELCAIPQSWDLRGV